jgi:hypothetical protein
VPLKSQQPPQTQAPVKCDPFYGHEYVSRLCARFITHLFACPEYPPQPAGQSQPVAHPPSHKLPYFIAYALHRTKLHSSVTFASLVLLQRLKARFPTARGSSGHRLYISAYMIASKVMCDDTYSNKSWGIVAQGMFALREINQMEREMCSYLEWELNVDTKTLRSFETMVKKDFHGQGPYPTYVLSMFSKRVDPAESVQPFTSSTSPIPSFGHGPPKDASPSPPPKPVQQQPHHQHPPLPPPSRKAATYSPGTPDTPSSSASMSSSSSPASSASPATPLGIEDFTVNIADPTAPPPTFTIASEKPAAVAATMPLHPLKGKMFAMAVPTAW